VSLLEVQDLKTEIHLRSTTVHAVDGVSFTVEAGETLGLVGESGCGKTMTGNSIIRLLPPGGHIIAGTILFDGKDVTTMSEAGIRQIRGNDIGMVFQDPMTSLNPTMKIGRQIALGVRLHRPVSMEAALDRAVKVLDMVGVPRPSERIDSYPHQLSGGLRQRVMIAMALACEPKLLIADEPTTALDVTIQAQILSLLDELKAELGLAMILITHDMGVIAGRTDRVMVMYAGRIVESARTVELFARMRHPYTEALLAAIPKVDQDTRQNLYTIPGVPPDLTHPPDGCRFASRCQYVADRCRNEDPVLESSDAQHAYACFYPRDAPAIQIAGGGDAGGNPDTRSPAIRVASHSAGDTSRFHHVAEVVVPRQDHDAAARPLLELRHVTKDFSVTAGGVLQRRVGTLQAVTDVSFAVAKGETFGVVGESGCGKTTTGRLVVGLEAPTSGSVLFDGEDLNTMSRSDIRRRRRNLQMIFQDTYSSLDPRMNVGTIIREPLAIQGIGDRPSQEMRVVELLNQVGMSPHVVDRYPHEFSGGQRQRIGLARALALNPRLIVADEPVSSLDVSVRSQVLNLMKELQSVHGLTYIVISHDLSVIRYLADRIAVMYLGMVVELGSSADIYTRAAHPYTNGLIEAIPVPDPAVEKRKKGVAVQGELPSPMNPPSGCRYRTRCPRAQDRCEQTPEFRSFGGEHWAACHFPVREPAVASSITTAS
jgi:peptide/nickel transport system ATP-binding protein